MENGSKKRTFLVVACISSFLPPFMGSAVNVAIPSIGSEFSMDAVLLTWVATAYVLTSAMLLIPFGKLADMVGRRKIFAWGLASFTATSFLCSIAPSGPVLIAFRALQGVSSALTFSTFTAILTSIFPKGERGKAIGLTSSTVYLGLTVGPFIGGLLTQHFGWRSLFLVNVPLGLSALLLTAWKFKDEWKVKGSGRFDLMGSLVYCLSITSFMYSFSMLPDKTGFWLMFTGVVSFFAFLKLEKKTEDPILDIKVFARNTVFAFSNLASLIHYSATFALGFILSLYLQYVKAMSPQSAGLVLVSQPVMMAIFSPYAGKLSDRIEPRIVASAGMGMAALGLFAFYFLGETTPIAFVISALAFNGIGFAFFTSPNTNAIMSSVDERHYGLASASQATARMTGQSLSMGIATLALAFYVGNTAIGPSNIHAFIKSSKISFLIFSILCIAGIFASIYRGKIHSTKKIPS